MIPRYIIALFAFGTIFSITAVLAAPSHNMSGYAWSSNVGWMRLNDCATPTDTTTCTPATAYGVNLDQASGILSGYAWSSNIGWVSFENSSCPPGYTAPCNPRVDMNSAPNVDGSRTLKGWARACSVYVSGCSGALQGDQVHGGWDGFIGLSGVAVDGSSFGVQLNDNNSISGYAWGDVVVGWMRFNGKVNDTNQVLSVDLKANGQDSLSISSSTPVSLSWTVSGFATTCTASNGWSGNKSTTSGIEAVGVVSSTTTYHITCSTPSASASDSVTVTIGGIVAPSVNLGAAPNPVASGTNTMLSWSVNGTATNCTAGGGWSGSKSTNGGIQASGPITSNTLFTITCTGPGGSGSDQVTVGLIGSVVPTQCSDGIDNDGDGLIDYGQDPGCDSPFDDDETDIKPIYREL